MKTCWSNILKHILSRLFEVDSDRELRMKGNLTVEGSCDSKGMITLCGGSVDSNEQENEDPPINVINTQDDSNDNKSPP